MKYKNKRIFSFLLIILMVFSIMPIKVNASENLSISVNYANGWGNTSYYNVSINNISSTKISNWKICIEASNDLSNATLNYWNGETYIEGNKIFISPVDWNKEIYANGTIDAGGFEITMPEGIAFEIISTYPVSYDIEESIEVPNEPEIPSEEQDGTNEPSETTPPVEEETSSSSSEVITPSEPEIPSEEQDSTNEPSETTPPIEEETSSSSSEVITPSEPEEIIVPNFVGKNVVDSKNEIDSWSNENNIKIEYLYEYSSDFSVDICYGQELKDNILYLNVSLGNKYGEIEDEDSSSNNFNILGDIGVSIDGNYSDWDNIAASYEYNWDNSQNCWIHGVWINGECFKTPEGTYDTNVRHKIQLVCDGAYVYLHIVMSRDYAYGFNGSNYQFFIDNNLAQFKLEKDGDVIENNINSWTPGTYEIDIIQENYIPSGTKVNGGACFITRYDKGYNAEMELKIPLSEMKKQNSSIPENFSKVEFFTPNLMYRKVTTTCTPTLPLIVTGSLFGLTLFSYGGYYYGQKKKSPR